MISKLAILFYVTLFCGVHGYPTFQTLIPNGMMVPSPCNPTQHWPGVGHKAIGGGGDRNPFGLDFAANNKAWTKELCMKDSDGDGHSNGAELGDPDCTWTLNAVPKYTQNLTHPGICEPLESSLCQQKNAWLKCPKNFSCPDFEKNSTEKIDLFFPKTSVPAQETTYMCYAFAMPNATKYHAIGEIPHIDNQEIMHHMLLYGCTKKPSDAMFQNPVQCLMGLDGCQTIIGLWGPGIEGECHPDAYGFPVGVGGFEYVVVQLHWNNPSLKPGMSDGSGMTLYYTDQLRPNDAMVMMAGQNYLEIPPEKESVKFEGSCTPGCSKLIEPKKVNIAAALIHMHMLGKSGSVRLISPGKEDRVLLNELSYDYNTPITHIYEKPIEFSAGDQIKVSCEFNSMKSNKTVYWGEGTQDEMCYGFITIYPAVPNFDFCGQYIDLGLCSMSLSNIYADNGCGVEDFSALLNPIRQSCATNCTTVCNVLMNGLKATGCLRFSMWHFIKQNWVHYSPDFVATLPLIEKCWPEEAAVDNTTQAPTTEAPGCNVNSAHLTNAPVNFISILLSVVSLWYFSRL